MGDEAPDGRSYTAEQVSATTQALDSLYKRLYAAPPPRLDVSDLQAWHAELAEPLGIVAGGWREGPITFGSYYGLDAAAIDKAVRTTFGLGNEWLEYVSCLEDEPELQLEELVKVAAYVHARLIRIHPFEDGNGRVSRLVLGVMFWGLGFDGPNLNRLERASYIAALNRYNHLGNDRLGLDCPALAPLKKVILEIL